MAKRTQFEKWLYAAVREQNYLNTAIESDADAFVTADLKYHSYHDAVNKILLIDAGHYETEIVVMNFVQHKMKKFISVNSKIKVLKYTGSTNPVKFYKQ